MNAKVSAKARTKAGQILKVVGLAAVLAASTTAFAESHGGGGHGGGGGHAGGFGGGHVSAPHLSGGHGFGGAPHFAAGQHFGGVQHFAPSVHAQVHVGRGIGYGHGAGAVAYGNHYAYRGRVGGFGYHSWGGGYWRGGFWPRAYYGWSYPLYLGLLPAVYATYWWGGVPYYYVNDVYYTYNPTQNGYVATDPPPVAGDYSDDVNAAAAADGSAADNVPPDVAAPDANIIAYPRNGQSEQQQSTDKFECHNWAKGQTGFDPTSQSSSNANAGTRDSYGRALAACLDGRGYTVR